MPAPIHPRPLIFARWLSDCIPIIFLIYRYSNRFDDSARTIAGSVLRYDRDRSLCISLDALIRLNSDDSPLMNCHFTAMFLCSIENAWVINEKLRSPSFLFPGIRC